MFNLLSIYAPSKTLCVCCFNGVNLITKCKFSYLTDEWGIENKECVFLEGETQVEREREVFGEVCEEYIGTL